MQKQINRKILFVKRPIGKPDENCFKIVPAEIPELLHGHVLLRTRYLSVDPYMRGRMNDKKSYIPPFKLNEAITGGIVAEVIETKSDNFAVGDYVSGMLAWQEYIVAGETELRKINPELGSVSTALGVLGMTGLTAYFGLLDIGKPQRNETVVISGAAGAVGMIVGQIAKIYGCCVVGIAGSDKKTKYLIEELGFDTAINYRTVSHLQNTLRDACPDGIDIYFDNVGGEISDAVLSLINKNARIALCGQISLYNETEISIGPRLQPLLLTNSALMQGFLVRNYSDRFDEGIIHLAGWLKEKKLQYIEHFVDGFENTPRAFIGLFSGENLGKQIVRVAIDSN